jgi:hypothetical protein
MLWLNDYKFEKYCNMENGMLKTKPPSTKLNKSDNASLLTFDLPALIKKMKQKENWTKAELNAMILVKRPDKQIVLAALHEGTEINSFQKNDSTSFQIIEGKLKFYNSRKSVTLEKGQLFTLCENIKYKLKTKEDTVLLLTTANNNFQASKSNCAVDLQ